MFLCPRRHAVRIKITNFTAPQAETPQRTDEMTRIEKEKRVVATMIRLYCRRKEHNAELCPACRELMEYASARLDACRFGEGKTSCRKCTVHCYKLSMRSRIRAVMRYAGPRMIFYHPAEALRHLLG